MDLGMDLSTRDREESGELKSDWMDRAAVLTVCLLLLYMVCCKPPEVQYVRVEVPVTVPCPEPPPLSMPELPIRNLTKDSPPNEVVQAYYLSILVLRSRLAEALTVLDGYRVNTPKTAPRSPKP